MKKLLSLFLACILVLGILPTAAFADSVEAALGEVNIYNGEHELDYLSINGAVKKQDYTYFLMSPTTVSKKESPAYCVNPTTPGVPRPWAPARASSIWPMKRPATPRWWASSPTATLTAPGRVKSGQQIPSVLRH